MKNNGQGYIVDLIKNTDDLSKLTGEDLVKANQQARASALAHNEAIKAQTFSAKAATIASKALSVALNTIAFAVIAQGISLIVNKMSEMYNATESAIKSGQEFANSLKQAFSNVSENTSTLSDLNEEYQKLSKGVDELGRNVSLTMPEYNRYKEIISQIHDIMPDLNAYFNEQGDAIGFVGGKLKDANKQYKEYLKNKADDFHFNGDENGNTPQSILDEYSTVSNWTNGKSWFDNIILDLTNGWKNFTYDIGVSQYTINDAPEESIIQKLETIQNKTKEEVSDYLIQNKLSLDKTDSITAKIIENMLSVKVQDINSLSNEEFHLIQQNIAQQITNLKGSIENKMSDVRQVLTNELYRNDSYWAIDDSSIRDNITTFISSMNSDLFNGLENVDIGNIDSIDVFIDKLVGLIKNNPEFSKAWTELFSIDEDIPINEYIEKVRNYIDTIANALGVNEENRIQWMISLGFDIEADKASIIGLKEKLSNLNGETKNQDTTKWVDSLTKEELEFAHSDEFINALEEQIKVFGKASLNAQDYEIALDKVRNAQNGLGKADKIHSITDFLGKLDEDAIDDYQSKISSLQSYLEKLRSGDYSPADLVSLAKDFGITGNSVEELTGKIQNLMDTEMDSITAQIDEILNTENLDEATREQVESLRQSLIDTNKEAQNLKETLSFKTGNALADVQSLSNGLDQLDKIYADILNKEDFDWSSILNNEGFTKAFEAYTDEYENFINTVSKAPNDINACQEAFNKLASAYIYGSGVLDEVTESTKAGTIAMLEQMGVENAAVIVEQALRVNQEMLAAQKTDTAKETENLTKATADEIDALAKEEGYCESTRLKLLALAMQKQLVNGTTLDFSRDISNIKDLVESISGACEALSELDRFKKNSYGYDNLPVGLRKQLEHDAQKEVDDALKKADDPVQFEMPSINFTGGTAAKDAREKLKKERENAEKDAEKTAEQFDWINTKLNNLIDTASRAKDKISDLLSFGSKKKQTQKAIESATKAIEAEYRAMKKYSDIARTLSADAAKATTETVTDSISNAVNDAVSNAVSSTAGVVNDAMQYVGKLPYIWGGTSLTNGADCSGFTQQLYKAYGINLDRTAQAQYNQNLGIKVTKEELQPGDLVFFNGYKGAGGVGHVGIYVGNGQFVHEPGSGQTAKVSYLSERKDFVGGKRYGNINNMPSSSDASAVSYGTSSGTYTKTVPGIDAKTLAHYQKLVREGSFDVETITNDKLKEAIKSYQEWYDKMKSCRDKIDELNGTLKELYKTMAEIPIEKRDKNVDTLESILGIRESKRDNINAVIVDPKKYASTKKAFKTAKSGLYKSLKTKAQKASSGLTDAEFKTLKSCIKSGKAVPKKILDSITDGALYSRCSEYNDAFYAHTQYADTALSTGDQIKRFNALSNQILSAEKAVTKQYKAAYNAASKDYAASLKKAASAGRKAKKVSTAKDTGLTKAEVNRIKSCIKSGKLIDSDLMLQLESTGAYSTFLKYNKAVLARDAEKEVLDSASFDYEKQRQQEIGKIQEVKTSRHQNIADKADEKVSRNNALMENETSASGKNKYLKDNNRLLDTQYKHLIEIAKLENNLVEAARLEAELQSKKNENTRQAYQNLADEHAAKADYYQLLEDNATSYKDKNSNEEHRLSQMKYQYLNLIKAAFGDELEQKRLAEELQSKINESYKTMFDNIRTGYEQTISLISNDISDLDNEVKKVQASGRLVDASFYNFKMSMEEKNLGVLREEEASLLEQLKNVKMYSSEWYECQDAVQSVQNAQADALVTIKEYKDAINEIANTIQNDIVSAFHDINSEADLLTTLLGDNLSDSDIGGLTQDGLAVLSLYVSQLNVSQDAAKSLHDEINSMQNAADNGILSFIDANGIKRDYASIHDLEKDIKELYSTYQDEIKGTYDYESKIIDLMKQKYQSELDYLKDLIDKKKESLEAEKDLYEYSKNIKNQVSSITSLRKQIAALQGDTSTETDARVQKLQSQLKDAEEELKDTEYDRYISDQEAMLDNLYNEYAELLTDLEKNRDRLLQEGLDLFAQTGSDVQDTIRDTAEQYNYRVTSAMDGIIYSIENMGSLSDYFSVGGTVTQSLDNIASEIQKAYTSLSAEIAKGNASVTIDSTGNTSDGTASIGQTGKHDTYGDSASSGNSGGASNTADRPSTSKPINLSAFANASGAAGAGAYKTFIENFLKKGTNKYDPKTTSSLNKYIHEKYGSALTVGEMSTLSKYLGLNYSASDLASENKDHQKYKKNILDTLKLQGFSKGGIVEDLEDAVKANGDSVLVSAKPGEAFLTKTDSENIQRFTKSLEYEELSRKLETVMRPMPDLSSINTNARVQDVPVSKQDTTVNVEFGNVDINLPNVMDYADFMTMAQHDPKFERLVTTIMCSNLTGKNYLAKNSIIFK